MTKWMKTVAQTGMIVAGFVALAPSTASAQNVWVFNQTDGPIKPCFRASPKNAWTDFGGIAPQGQFAWGDFLAISKAALGVPATATEATIRFTFVPIDGPGVTCPATEPESEKKSVFVAEPGTNVYLFVGGREETRRLNSK